MLYLVALGWPWFAGALALGALVGFVTFNTAKSATFSGGWIIVAGVLALAIGGAVSWLEMLSGRTAATFDIALLAGLAYAVGLPVGGALKSLGGAPEPKRPKVAPVVVTRREGPIVAAPEPIIVPQEIVASPEAPASADVAPAIAVEAPPAKKSLPGLPPARLAAPRGGAPDDLARIKGLGPKSVEKLHALGVFHYDQIAAWNLDNARWIGAAIGAPGRVERSKWIQQARALIEADEAVERA